MPFDITSPRGTVPSLFSTRNEAEHRVMKRPVAHAYSMSTMLELEPQVNVCVSILERKLEGIQGKATDFGRWLHFFAWDVISSIAFSNNLGFMEQEKDVDGIIAALEGRQMYNSTIGQSPLLHRLLLGNSLVEYLANIIPVVARFSKAK